MALKPRQRARALLVKALYQWQLADHSYQELVDQFSKFAEYSRIDRDYFCALLRLVLENASALDTSIAKHAVRSLEQLDVSGRSVLLLGLAELKFRSDVPPKVVINEAVELAKRYGAAESYRFVNAVLDKVARETADSS